MSCRSALTLGMIPGPGAVVLSEVGDGVLQICPAFRNDPWCVMESLLSPVEVLWAAAGHRAGEEGQISSLSPWTHSVCCSDPVLIPSSHWGPAQCPG